MCKNITEMHRFLIDKQPGETQTVIKDLIFSYPQRVVCSFFIHFNQFSLRELSVTQK